MRRRNPRLLWTPVTGRCTATIPDLAAEGKNPFILDSKPATGDYKSFIMGEVRYSSLAKLFPETAEKLFAKAEEEAKEKRAYYEKLAE